MNQPHRWRFGAVAGAVALIASVVTLPAYALSLGRISVLSALGEPLRAEIDVAQITPEEAASLKAGVGTTEAFKAAGLEYTPVLAGLEVTLQRRADGRSYLRLTSSRPVSEPFVDLVLQATWSAGRLTRDYTMLFDPPGSRANASATAAPAPTAPILSRPAAPSPVPAPAQTPPPAAASESAPLTPPATREARSAPPAPASRAEARVKPAAPRVASADRSGAVDKQLTVKPGDTAGRIAAQNKPGAVSLDQMLVAMLRSNPNAFINGNINRLKSGAVLALPDGDAAGAVPAGEASQTILAQSKDFNNFRRKLAEGVATTPVDSADRQAGGKVTAKVEDRAPATATPDKLTLSKGSVQGKSAAATAEDAIAKNRQASDTSARVAELSKNISDLNKLGVAPGAASTPPSTASPATAASAARVPGVALPTPSAVVARPAPVVTPPASAATAPTAAASQPASTPTSAAVTAPAVAQAASAAASAAAATASAASAASASSAPTADSTAAKPAVVVTPTSPAPVTPPPETSFLDDLLKNDLVLPLGAVFLALMAGLGIYSYRKRKGGAPVDSSFLESRLQPDSFFGASGGQRIDTNEASASGSSLVYSPSQLDAAGDVDPVAEADVYLAYGRDLQAEEILKEALRTAPGRVAIHAKLAEIYAKRRDSKAFQTVAQEAFNLTKGDGPEWAHLSEMGRELDPLNPLYKPGGLPADDKVAPPGTTHMAGAPSAAAGSAAVAATTGVHAAGMSAFSPTPSAPSMPAVDVDLDLDFPLGGMQDGHTSPAPIAAIRTPEPIRAPVLDKLDMDFSDISSKAIALTYPVPIARAPIAQPSAVVPAKAAAPVATAAPVAALPDSGMLEFDLDSLSLDINGPNTQSPPNTTASANEEDPLTTKFQLAEEFRSLGDADGARSLAEEVLTEARGPLKVKAQAFLNSLV
jgi:pilus assembly protein FimV